MPVPVFRWRRLLLAALLSPLPASALVLLPGLAAYAGGYASYALYAEMALALLLRAVPVAVVLGIPAFLILQRLGGRRRLVYAVAGAVIALLISAQSMGAPDWRGWLAALPFGSGPGGAPGTEPGEPAPGGSDAGTHWPVLAWLALAAYGAIAGNAFRTVALRGQAPRQTNVDPR
ncbi:MAG: hypothetical protein J0H09_26435 [Burkholderiales bacterium]|nr:hypothetical protein [Burkholderiales bacterium]